MLVMMWRLSRKKYMYFFSAMMAIYSSQESPNNHFIVFLYTFILQIFNLVVKIKKETNLISVNLY